MIKFIIVLITLVVTAVIVHFSWLSYSDFLNSKQIAAQATSDKLEAQNLELRQKLTLAGYRVATDSATQKQIVRFYINKYFGEQAPRAEKIFNCESLLYPELVHINDDGGGDYGIAQINRNTWEEFFESEMGVDFDIGVYDPAINIAFAYIIYDRSGGFNPWVCDKYV